MPKALMTKLIAISLVCTVTFTAHAMADAKQVNVPPGELVSSLEAFEAQTSVELVYQSEQLRAFRTHGVRGNYEPKDAIQILLQGLPVTLEVDANGAMVIGLPRGSGASVEKMHHEDQTQVNRDSSGPFRLAQATQGLSGETASVDTDHGDRDSQNRSVELQEVVVTAQKRAERLQDVPVPVALINNQALVDSNQLALQDYYEKVPGLVVAGGAAGPGYTLSLRGIGNWGGGPAVSVLVDDVPFGSSTFFGGGTHYPDIDPSDLARIEVLRGPQGTLYGASSMGGLIKYVTLDPSTQGLTGRLEAGTSTVVNGPHAGYTVRGGINVPINDTMAIRASAFTLKEPGYIDNVLTGKEAVDTQTEVGGHLAALWKPTEDFSLKLSALVDHSRTDGWNDVEAGLGDLRQKDSVGVGYQWSDQAYSASGNAKLAGVAVTSITGYNIREQNGNTDYSVYASSFKNGIDGALSDSHYKTKKFTQEIRLSATIAQRVDWLLGGFYTHEQSDIAQTIFSVDPRTGENFGTGYYSDNPSIYAELAGFVDLTVHVTDRFDVQIGGRYSEVRETSLPSYTVKPIFANGSTTPVVGPTQYTNANPVTYLLTPSFKISPDLMLYSRLASGYRAGGHNLSGCTSFGFPCEYQPDKTKNYEVGAKGEFLEHRFSFDTSIYYIDWSGFQIGEVQTQAYIANAGKAKSQGIELSVEARPRRGLTISTSFSYGDPVLTKDLPAATRAVGYSGETLPFTGRFSGNLSVNQEFPITGQLTGFVRPTVSYVGDRKGIFPKVGAAPRDDFPAYTKVDFLVGLSLDAWTLKLYADNVTDTRGVLNRGASNFPTGDINYIRPRTVGLSAEYKF